MCMAGAILALSTMVQGPGWICIVLVVFVSWRPEWTLLFAFVESFQPRLRTSLDRTVIYQLFLTIPYVLSIAALAVMARHARFPNAHMQPYRRGDR